MEKIEIKIVDEDELKKILKQENALLEKLEKGEKVSIVKKHSLMVTPKAFASLFSAERIKVMKALQKSKPESIEALAKILDRPYRAVFRDVKHLESFGLIETLKKETTRKPKMAEEIQFSIAIPA